MKLKNLIRCHIIKNFHRSIINPILNICDFFNPFTPKAPNHLFDDTKDYDIFGREIYTITDNAGNVSKVALNEDLLAAAHKLGINNENISEIAKFIDNVRLKDYLVNYQPNYSNLDIPEYETMDEFISRIGTPDYVDPEIHHEDADMGHSTDMDTDAGSSDLIDLLTDFLQGVADEGV